MPIEPLGGGVGGGQSHLGLALGPQTNTFNGATQAAAETARDTYASNNADWLAEYDENPNYIIRVTWPETPANAIYYIYDGSNWDAITGVVQGEPTPAGGQLPDVDDTDEGSLVRVVSGTWKKVTGIPAAIVNSGLFAIGRIPTIGVDKLDSAVTSRLLPTTGATGTVPKKNADGTFTLQEDDTGTDDQTAAEVSVSTTKFGNLLSSAEDDVQKVVDKFDDVEIPSPGTATPVNTDTASAGESNKYSRQDHDHGIDPDDGLSPSDLDTTTTIQPPLTHTISEGQFVIGLPDATEDASGAESAADKTKLNTIDTNADDISGFNAETTAANADKFPFTDTSDGDAGKNILLSNLIPRIRSGMATVNATTKGLMAPSDKAKIDTVESNAKDDQDASEVSVDADGFVSVLSDQDTTAQSAFETIDEHDHDISELSTIQDFVFGSGYDKDDVVRYQDVLYRVINDVAPAREIPPLDSTNWAEISSHRIEGYGEIHDHTSARADFDGFSIGAPLTGTSEDFIANIHPNQIEDIPAGLLVVDSGKLKARIDGVGVTVPADEDYQFTFISFVENSGDSYPAYGGAIQVMARVILADDTIGAWRILKSVAFNFLANDQGGVLTTVGTSDVSFNLDTDDELEFGFRHVAVSGSRHESFVTFSQTDHLELEISGIRETRHVLAHGTGDNEGQITIEKSDDGTVTPIIDVEAHGGPTYVGPVASRVFEIGEDYGLGERVEYQEAVYRAIADITDASEVPSLDTDNWVPLSSHGIEGYGVPVNDVSAALSFEDVATLAYGPNTSVNYYDLVLSGVSEMLQDGVAHIDDEGRLVADTDDLEVSFAVGQTLTWQWAADGQGTDSIVIYGFLGFVNSENFEIIGVTGFGTASRDDDVLTISIPTQDRTFLLNEGDTLRFQLSINATYRPAGTASQGDSETRAVATLNGYRRRRYALGWGTEEDDGKLVATDHNTSTPIIEFRDGEPIYIGKVTALRDFEYGASYVTGENVEYLEVIYRARRNISSADTAPPLDSHNWRAVRGHDLVGYAEVLDSARATYGLAMANVEAQTDEDIEGAELIPLTVSNVSPEVSGHLEVDNGNLQSMVGGLKVVFRNEDDYAVRLGAVGTEAASIAFSLDARVVGDELWTSTKTGNLLIAADESAGEVVLDFDPPADPVISFTLNSDDELEFRLSYFVISGNRDAGTVTFSDLEVHLDHSEGTLATIGFGTGSDNHKLQGHDPHHDETTDLIEFDSDGVAKWIGPLEDHVVLDRNLREPGSMTGNFLGDGTHRFEIVSGVPGVGEITHAAALGDTQVRVGISTSQESAGLDEADAIIFHGTGSGDAGAEQAQFRVYSRTYTPITDNDDEVIGYVFVFTGRVVQLHPSLSEFAFGSTGDDVDIAFLSRSHVAASLAHHSSIEHSLIGYNGSGNLTQVPYRHDSFLDMHVARPSGIWIKCTFIGDSDDFSEEEQYHSYTNNDGTVDLLVSQRINNPFVDYRNWIKKYDVIELVEDPEFDDNGFLQGDYNVYYVLDNPEIDNIDTNDNFNDDTAILRYSLRRVGGDSDNTHPSTSTMFIITNRHGRRIIPRVYNSNVDFVNSNRFIRIDLGESYNGFEYLGISFENDSSNRDSFGYVEIPVELLKECVEVDDDTTEAADDANIKYFSLRARTAPNDDVRWGIARSNLGDDYEGIAVFSEDTGDDAQPLRIDFIQIR